MSARYRAGKRLWNPEDDAVLLAEYPDGQTAAIAQRLGRTVGAVQVRAWHMGLRKSDAFLRNEQLSGRWLGARGLATRFRPGQQPANKGLRRPGWHRGRMQETQFKPGVRAGVAARKWRPIGTIATDQDGYQRIKLREAQPGEATGFGNSQVWKQLHRHLWEQAYGPVPAGYSVVFKDGNKAHCVLENLELVSRGDLLRRNSIHTKYPGELGDTIRLLGALTRKIRRRTREEQNRRPA